MAVGTVLAGTVHHSTKRPPGVETSQIGQRLDDALIAVLVSERDKHLRLVAGVPDGVAVDLSLIKLPDDALMFPSLGSDIDFTRLRDAHAVTRTFERQARRRFPKLRFHDLRGSHETALLDAGVPVHVVAARCGH